MTDVLGALSKLPGIGLCKDVVEGKSLNEIGDNYLKNTGNLLGIPVNQSSAASPSSSANNVSL